MTIAVDFDGTIVYGDYPRIDSLQQFAKSTLQKWHDEGHYIIIWTCRCDSLLIEAINYLLENEVPFDRINDNRPEDIRKYGHNSRKINADVYIDDKNVGGFDGWYNLSKKIL